VSDEVAWTRSKPACVAREFILSAVCRPLIALYARREVDGLANLVGLNAPVIFVANHCSHIDTPLILRALPYGWRRRTGVAAAADYFYKRRLMAEAVSLAFNTVPIERNGERVRHDAASVLDGLLAERWSLLVFAEGTRSRSGTVGALQSGAAVLAARHDLPIVPVFVTGTHAIMPVGRRWMRRRRARSRQVVRVAFGPPIPPRPREQRREVMEDVRSFFAAQGAATTPNRRIAAKQAETAGAA
jgi:1-acyl-sn-glycerol-3-phosphate acyltransferase